MDLRRLRIGEWLTGALGVVLLVALFLPWYGFAGITATGFQALSVIDVILAAIAVGAIATVPITAAARAPSGPIVYQALLWIAVLVGAILALIRLVDTPGIGLTREIGVYLAFLASAGLLASLLSAMRDERLSRPGHPTDATGVPIIAPPEIETLPAPPAA